MRGVPAGTPRTFPYPLLQLVADADILIENHRPRQIKEWGLDWEALSAANSR